MSYRIELLLVSIPYDATKSYVYMYILGATVKWAWFNKESLDGLKKKGVA